MSTAAPTKTIRVAVVGNPNTGKSTLFTTLAGVRQRVGNYPGVTVEKKMGADYNYQAWIEDPDGVSIVLVEIPADHPLRLDTRS